MAGYVAEIHVVGNVHPDAAAVSTVMRLLIGFYHHVLQIVQANNMETKNVGNRVEYVQMVLHAMEMTYVFQYAHRIVMERFASQTGVAAYVRQNVGQRRPVQTMGLNAELQMATGYLTLARGASRQ